PTRPGPAGQPTRGQLSQGTAMKAGEPATPPVLFGGPPPVIRPAGVMTAPRPPWRGAVRCGRTWPPRRRQPATREWAKTQRTRDKACEQYLPQDYDARSR